MVSAALRALPLRRPLAVVLVALSLVGGLIGGLLRAGVALPVGGAAWVEPAIGQHAALLICGFLGSVIGFERAVAVRARPALLAPLLSAAAGLALLAGWNAAARAGFVVAALIFVAVNAVLVARQRAAHTVVLLLGALAWLLGNLAFWTGYQGPATLAWWFGFLVLTIAAERLEMTRLMRRRPGAWPLFGAIVALLLAGATLSCPSPDGGGALYGAALSGLALWLMRYDIARRTVTTQGLSRYMALALLGGYGWLLLAGAGWIGLSLGQPTRDLALHALAIGFVLSMVMAHAPVIAPAVLRIKVQFGWPFYLPLGLLHGSLVLRLVGGAFDGHLRATGALLNVAALALFACTMVGAAVSWRVMHRRDAGKPHGAGAAVVLPTGEREV